MTTRCVNVCDGGIDDGRLRRAANLGEVRKESGEILPNDKQVPCYK
jgi:hypothetical protein